MTTISKDANLTTLINVFTVAPANQSRLVELLSKATDASVRHARGFVFSALHRSRDGTKVTIYFRKPPLRESGLLPRGGIARFYGTARIYKSGPIYEEIWKRLIEPEKKSDPDKKGFGVLIKVERAEDLGGAPLAI